MATARIGQYAGNRKGAWNETCRNGHTKGRGSCPRCKQEWTAKKLEEKRARREPKCQNGHPKTEPGKCLICIRLHGIRRARLKRKSIELEPVVKTISRAEVPIERYMVPLGFWATVAETMRLLGKDEALRIDLKGGRFVYGGLYLQMQRVGVRFSHTVQKGVVYLWRLN